MTDFNAGRGGRYMTPGAKTFVLLPLAELRERRERLQNTLAAVDAAIRIVSAREQSAALNNKRSNSDGRIGK